MNSFFDSAIQALRHYVDHEHQGNVSSAARALDVSIPTLHTWLKNERKPSMTKLAPILDNLGATIALPTDEQSKDVCFIDARLVPAGEGQQKPAVEDYLAVPLVDEVGAGPGYIPQGVMKSWFLVWKHQSAIAYKRDLIAVQIGKHSTSMLPTLSPEDIVLVDRQDKDVSKSGRIMLVTDPDGEGMIKRVATERQEKKRDVRITYYSDNTVQNPPSVYSLREDFFNDWERAIVGRVVWAWSDVHNK